MKRELTNTETGIQTIKGYAKELTKKPGVYKMLDISNKILYIGKAKNLFNRVKSYTNLNNHCLLYTSPSPRDRQKSRMPSSA